MATYDMNQKQEIVDYYMENGLEATAKKFNMTKEQLMDDFYGIGQSERGDSQGGYSDTDDQSSSVKDTLLNILGIGKANAADGSFVDNNKGMLEQFADYQLDNLGKARDEIGSFLKGLVPNIRMTEGNTEMQDTIDDPDVGVTVDKEAMAKKEKNKMKDVSTDEDPMDTYDNPETPKDKVKVKKQVAKPQPKQPELSDEELETMYADISTGLGLKGKRGKDGSLLPGQKKQNENEEMGFDGKNPGMYQPKGSNFWSVDTQSPYWDTAEGYEKAKELYNGEVPSFVGYKPKEKQLDLAELKKLFSF